MNADERRCFDALLVRASHDSGLGRLATGG
jgi:hypothetical protein